MKRFFAKPNTWYDEGTEAFLDCEFGEGGGPLGGPMVSFGLFRGTKDGEEDEEMCSFDEFYILSEHIADDGSIHIVYPSREK